MGERSVSFSIDMFLKQTFFQTFLKRPLVLWGRKKCMRNEADSLSQQLPRAEMGRLFEQLFKAN